MHRRLDISEDIIRVHPHDKFLDNYVSILRHKTTYKKDLTNIATLTKRF